MHPSATDYDDLDRLLAASALSPSASEAHGLYCALLAADVPAALQRWLSELLPETETGRDPQADRCRSLLGDLASATREQIAGPALGFDLLLPPEDRSLRERASALHEWTRGFLFGLGLAGVEAVALSPASRDALDDLLEITHMDLDDLDEDEANEQALTEVVEFVRVAALLLYEDATASAPARREEVVSIPRGPSPDEPGAQR
ncbi:MAG: YecA family protein [Thiohalocapsa sp.]|jgi:uncharacterized protein YgfB (UPF0149 family)